MFGRVFSIRFLATGMVGRRLSGLALVLALALVGGADVGASEARGAEYPELGLDVFEPGADGERLIDAALVRAKAEGKRVVLIFGTNRSTWSRRLHDALESDPDLIARFRDDFVLVKIDVNWRKDPTMNRFTVDRFDKPTRMGLPALVLLDAAGEKLAAQNTGELEAPAPTVAVEGGAQGTGYVREKLLTLFAAWAPAR